MAIKNIGLGGSDYWVDGDVLLGSDLKDTFNKTECVDNLTQDIDSGSTVDEYPSAKAVYDKYGLIASSTTTSSAASADFTIGEDLAVGECFRIDVILHVLNSGQRQIDFSLQNSASTSFNPTIAYVQMIAATAGGVSGSNRMCTTNGAGTYMLTMFLIKDSNGYYNFTYTISSGNNSCMASGGGRYGGSFTLDKISFSGSAGNFNTGSSMHVYKSS